MVSNPSLNGLVEISKYKLENVFFEIRQDNINLANLASLSSLTQSITTEKLYYSEESKPSSFKINIIELIDKLLLYTFDQRNDLLEKSYLNSIQKEVQDDLSLIASFRITKNKNSRKYFLMYASYDGGIFFLNEENEDSFLYILQNSLIQKSIRLHREESSIEILSNKYSVLLFLSIKNRFNHLDIVKPKLCLEKFCKGVIINKNTDNCFLKSLNSPDPTYPILNINSSNVKSLSQSNVDSLSSKKFQLSKVSSCIKNEKIKIEDNIDKKKKKESNIGRIEDFNLINLNIPTFHQTICPNVLFNSFEEFEKMLKIINPTISDNQTSICKGLIFSKLEECINWKLGKIKNTATVSDFTNNCSYNLDIDQVLFLNVIYNNLLLLYLLVFRFFIDKKVTSGICKVIRIRIFSYFLQKN